MKIVHVITRLIIGGAQENTVLTCRGHHENGHDVTLIAGPETGPEGSLWDQARNCGYRCITLDSLRRAIDPLRDLECVGEIARTIAALDPDVVHTHSSKAGILGRTARVRRIAPVLVHTIHGMSFNRTQPEPIQAAYRFVERRAAKRTDAIIAVADAMIEQSVAAGIAAREKFCTIRSGMETGAFAPSDDERREVRAGWAVHDDDIVVGTVARLFENKGYEEIIPASAAAAAKNERLRFVWIGDGKHRSRYENELERRGIRDRVTLTGLVPPTELPRLLNGVDLVLHASRWEGLPRVLVQGLLMEKPAISFDNDGAPEVVIPNETGVLVPFGNIDGLTEAILILAKDKALRDTLGSHGRARCLELFDWRKMVSEIEALYERLLANRAK